VPVLLLLLVLPVVLIVLTPLILIQRYRMGTARRLARAWAVTLSIALTTLSAMLFLTGAAVTAVWVPDAFSGAVTGVLRGSRSASWDWP
jgi:hypothetical protein